MGNYGSEKFPHAKRIFSRPYSIWHDSSPISELLYFLNHKFGGELLGGPFLRHLDTDWLLSQEKFPAIMSWHFSDFKEKMEKAIEQHPQLANKDRYPDLNAIYELVKNTPEEITDGEEHTRINKALLRHTLNIWEKFPMLDTRLSEAEELFFSQAEDIGSIPKTFFSFNKENIEAHRRNLKWLAAPENAYRFARMFLYSRLSQHFGEKNPASYALSERIASLASNYASGNLPEDEAPEDYYRRHALDAMQYYNFDEPLSGYSYHPRPYDIRKPATQSAMIKKFKQSVSSNKDEAPDERHILDKEKKGSIANRHSYFDTIGTILADYKRLADGSWATQKLNEFENLLIEREHEQEKKTTESKLRANQILAQAYPGIFPRLK